MKLLFGIPSPFDYSIVEKYQKEITCDYIKPRYYDEVKAYKIIRDYFLENDYDYLAIACSDIVVKQYHLDLISKGDYDVISGMMNICLDHLDVYNVTSNVVVPFQPEFMWYTESTLPKVDVFAVKWSGFPLMRLSRKIVERYEFEPLSSLIPDQSLNGSLDVVLCWKLYQDNTPIYCNKNIKLLHLKEICTQSQPRIIKEPITEIQRNGVKHELCL